MGKIFVFGSNEAGRHGKGAALWALRNRNAHYGQGYGLQGQSFAIPTKDHNLDPLPLEVIKRYTEAFLRVAEVNSHLEFEVSRIGCGLAGYTDDEIGPMFKGAPPNVTFMQYEGYENWEKYR